MSADGKIAGTERKQIRISSDEDKDRVTGLRKRYDAVLVGVGTVLADDPHLTVKGLDYDDNPIRIIIDPNGRTPDDALVLDERAPTIMITSSACVREWDCEETIRFDGELCLSDILETLAEEISIESILVEGGGETIAAFFREGLVDLYTVFVGGLIIGGKNAPTPADGEGWVSDGGVKMVLKDSTVMGNGVVLTFEPAH
jgi:2,5-diamino-6-(ribosylamino)-4(3H)-pyrimidinone 5'-phosphate reductase